MNKLVVRFFVLYFLLTTTPWFWFSDIPGISFLLDLYDQAEVWLVTLVNDQFLHVKEMLNRNGGGSGDTSYAWARLYTVLIVSLLGAIIWTIIIRKRQTDDSKLSFWLRNMVRYYLSLFAFSYGIIKVFALQMYFPNLSQLATPLGDYLPMRLSWMFIGYSEPYQIFSGIAECMVGLLLFFRRTVLLGALMGVGVFANVVMLNLSYDIPVKIFSMQLLFCSLFLVSGEWKRLSNFFLQNKIADASDLYDINLSKKWQKVGRWVFKIFFLLIAAVIPFFDYWKSFQELKKVVIQKPIEPGVYDIHLFVQNHDTLTVVNYDEAIWKDIIFDVNGMGSINSQDTIFRQRYRRGYFNYNVDTINHVIAFKKFASDTTSIFEMNYNVKSKDDLELWGKVRTDSVYVHVRKSNRHFQLAERQFHWISEANR